MKKLFILSITAILMLFSVSLKAQTERRTITPPKGSKVNLVVQNAAVHIEGYDGDDIIFESYVINSDAGNKLPAAAAGLKEISALTPKMRYLDNFFSWGGDNLTGVRNITPRVSFADTAMKVVTGNSVIYMSSASLHGLETSTSTEIEGINPVTKETATGYTITVAFNSIREILIKVPRNLHLQLNSTSYIGNPEISVKNLTGEVEVTTSAASVLIDNVPGLASLFSRRQNSGSGKVVIRNSKWLQPRKAASGIPHPLSISAVNSDIDLSVPADLKATFTVETPKGDLYSDLSLQKEQPASSSTLKSRDLTISRDLTLNSDGSAVTYLSIYMLRNKYSGTLNGGGIPVSIRSENGNVLLRKEK